MWKGWLTYGWCRQWQVHCSCTLGFRSNPTGGKKSNSGGDMFIFSWFRRWIEQFLGKFWRGKKRHCGCFSMFGRFFSRWILTLLSWKVIGWNIFLTQAHQESVLNLRMSLITSGLISQSMIGTERYGLTLENWGLVRSRKKSWSRILMGQITRVTTQKGKKLVSSIIQLDR